jgi:predicted O-methyltransferase YrrM
MYLADLTPVQVRVGYGQFGTGGNLGYEGKQVSVQGRAYPQALSTHPPARLLYHLGGAATRFRSRVAINDDVSPGGSHADFTVIADGRQVAEAREVQAGAPPRQIEAVVDRASLLELVVTTTRWPYSHAVWLDPDVDGEPARPEPEHLDDPLRRATITLPPALAPARRCIATVASRGYEFLLDDMLGSLLANGACGDARLVVFVLGDERTCEEVIAKYRALPIYCTPRRPINAASKAVLYSVARVVEAEQYVCLDADTLVLRELDPVFGAIEACVPGSIFVAREGNGHHYASLDQALFEAYGGRAGDREGILGRDGSEGSYPLVANDGIFAGGREALLTLDATIRAMPGAVAWLDARPDLPWRNQYVFNLAVASLGMGVELTESYNVQLHTSDVEFGDGTGIPRLSWQQREVRVLHLSGWGRTKYAGLSGKYAAVSEPLVGPGDGDGYRTFLHCLRAWLGRYGIPALAWSFYGTTDGVGARVRDPSMLPVLGALHYLVRANACASFIETGTARGVSAACLASALAHRPRAQLITFDPLVLPEREELWGSLPVEMRACIDARRGDSLAGMRELVDAGAQFDGALLDSNHTEEHLWAELQLATALVKPEGLILVHDCRWVDGIACALERMEASGYGVVRLLCADSDMPEDSELGLAVIDNHVRKGGSA